MEGNQFYLAAVVGVTGAQEEVFRRLPMGGDDLLAPIFRYGLPVRVGDITSLLSRDAQYLLAQATGRGLCSWSRRGAGAAEGRYAGGSPPGKKLPRRSSWELRWAGPWRLVAWTPPTQPFF